MSDRVLIILGLMCSMAALVHNSQIDIAHTYQPPLHSKKSVVGRTQFNHGTFYHMILLSTITHFCILTFI